MARSRLLTYSLQTLMFALLCVGGFMAAYRAGRESGYKDGQSKWRGEQYLPRAYFVGNLAGPNGRYSVNEVKNSLTTTIDPTSWDSVGGPASLQVLVDRDGNPVFVISQHAGGHEEVARALEELRAGNDEVSAQ